MIDHLATDTASPETSSAPALRVSEVSKHFDGVAAVDSVSLEVGHAELVALVGPSGCGKSTLLRMIAGLLPVESGYIEMGGTTVDDGHRSLPPEQRRVGLVFQEHALFPHLTVAKNVGFGVRTTTRERSGRVDEMLELVGLGGYGDRFPHELSGGERQRVALARALAPDPALMLLDEPFASLDPNLRARVRSDVVEVLSSTSTPAVFVTHDQAEALAVGDRIAVMRSGHVLQMGDPDAVFHRPTNRFVAAFMGEADFMSVAELRTAFGSDHDGLGNVDADHTVMVRPDDVGFTADAAGGASVVRAEFRGSSWCYTLELASGATVRSMRSHIAPVAIGTTVRPSLIASHEPVIVHD
jgi:iron(III) transport system ATP-binding protein